jgi:hypothetical protein
MLCQQDMSLLYSRKHIRNTKCVTAWLTYTVHVKIPISCILLLLDFDVFSDSFQRFYQEYLAVLNPTEDIYLEWRTAWNGLSW